LYPCILMQSREFSHGCLPRYSQQRALRGALMMNAEAII